MRRTEREQRCRPGRWRGRPPVLGLDVGGVFVDRVAEGEDTSFFGTRPMETPAVDGSIDALADLLVLFEWRVHIVSKAGPKIADLTRQWLGHHDLVGSERIPAGNVHFVRKRHEKAPVCQKYGITHFVDDRLDVLTHLESVVPHRYLLTGGLGLNAVPVAIPTTVTVVDAWPALTTALAADLDGAT